MLSTPSSWRTAGAGIAVVCLAILLGGAAQAVPDEAGPPRRVPVPAAPDARMPVRPTPGEGSPIRLAANAQPPILAGNPALVPLAWAGKYLTRTGRPNEVAACTAQFITSRVILLAAHCVRDHYTGEFYPIEGAKFLLQYQNDDYSKEYNVVCRATWTTWPAVLKPGESLDNPNSMTPERRKEYMDVWNNSWQWDYAFVLLDGDSITGHYNYSINTQWNRAVETGYPQQLMGGKVIQAIMGDVFSTKVLASQADEPNEQVLWQGNPDLTYGASGGAWVVKYSGQASADTNIIVGLNSYINDRRPGASFGPVFTDAFDKLLNYVQGGCK